MQEGNPLISRSYLIDLMALADEDTEEISTLSNQLSGSSIHEE
jgi:hypothetical protein